MLTFAVAHVGVGISGRGFVLFGVFLFLAPTMSAPPIVKATLQAALINAGSNVLAQGIKAYRDQVCIFVFGFFSTIHPFVCLFARCFVFRFSAAAGWTAPVFVYCKRSYGKKRGK